MNNVIELRVPHHRLAMSRQSGSLIQTFADHRRGPDDVFWLKENAELLNILECTGRDVAEAALAPHDAFYERVAERLRFFPQYYRFLLSICLDYEDLRGHGSTGEELCHWVAEQGLDKAEFSYLQRAEARRLLDRRGVLSKDSDPELDARLHGFMNRHATFALPNKKAAYELTHIVFYLSQYGRRDPGLSEAAFTSLDYAGVLAFLDQNFDLLAEVCVAMRYAGRTPSPLWEQAVEDSLMGYVVEDDPNLPLQDDYHTLFVSSWLMSLMGNEIPLPVPPARRSTFHAPPTRHAPLRVMSATMFDLGSARSGDWHKMRDVVADAMDHDGQAILQAAEASTANFGSFFEGFARA